MKFSQEQILYTRNNGVGTLILDCHWYGTSEEGIKEFKQQMKKFD